jgi:hypothetical protein
MKESKILVLSNYSRHAVQSREKRRPSPPRASTTLKSSSYSHLIEEMLTDNRHDEIRMSEDADRRFHELIAESSENSAIIAAMQMLWDARALGEAGLRIAEVKVHALAGRRISQRMARVKRVTRSKNLRRKDRSRIALLLTLPRRRAASRGNEPCAPTKPRRLGRGARAILAG